MKTKRHFGLITAIIMVITACFTFACDCNGDSDEEEIDTSKVQIYVTYYNRGFGGEYVQKLKHRYEEIHKNDPYGDKTGVQVIPLGTTDSNMFIDGSVLLQQNAEVFFSENTIFTNLTKVNALLDISDTVKNVNTYDNKKIEDKLNDQQKSFLNMDGKYYGVPHYQSGYGIIYDIDLFEANGYYFRDGYTVPSGFEANKYDVAQYGDTYEDDMFTGKGSHKTDKRTAGPDGKFGTTDDGLPRTYDEFFWLCEYISSQNSIPLSWAGSYYTAYLNHLLHDLITDGEGFEGMLLNYSGSKDEVSEMRKTQTVKAAVSFLSNIIKTDRYHNPTGLAFGTYEHTQNQADFLRSSIDASKDIAMIVDGAWWEREATDAFNDIVTAYGENYSKEKRNFGWLQLPRATMEEYNSQNGKTTYADLMNSFIFARANIDESKKDLIKDFIAFACSDESLCEFTITTNSMKGLNYRLSDSDYDKLSNFGKNYYSAMTSEKATIFYPYANSDIYKNNVAFYDKFFYNVDQTTGVALALKSGMGVNDVVDKLYNYTKTGLAG